MNPITFNMKYLVQKINEDNSLLALNIIDNQRYTLRRIPSSDTFGRHNLENIWKNSTKAASDSFISYHDAGVVCSVDNSYVSKEGYFLAEPYIEAKNIVEADLSAKELKETLQEIANEVHVLSLQKLVHGNLTSSSILLSQNSISLVNSRAVTFVRGKPSHEKEIHTIIKRLIEAGAKVSPQMEKEITEEKAFSEFQNNFTKKQCPSSWLMGLEIVPSDIAYRLSTSISLGYPIVHVKGRWDNGLSIIAKEVSVFREIAGRITLLIESQKINEINHRIKKLTPNIPSFHSNPLISYIKNNSHLPIEIFLLHKLADSNSIIEDLSKFLSLQKNSKMSLVVFSEHNIASFSPDYIINTFTPPTEVSLIATRTLTSSEQTQWVSQFSNVTPLETYLLLTSNFDTISQSNDISVYYVAQLLPGVLLGTAIRASENMQSILTTKTDSDECNIAVAEGRIWPLSTKKQYSTENMIELKNSLFDTLCIEKYLRYPEIIWLLDTSIQTNEPMQLRKAGEAFLRYWNTRGQDLGVKRIFPLFNKAKLFLKSICSDDTLSEFILGTIEDFYQSTEIIAKLFDTLQPLSDLAGGNANLRASILTLTVWVESVTREESEVINLTLETIKKNINFPKTQKLLFRLFIFSSSSVLILKQKTILKTILEYEEIASQQGCITEIAFSQQIFATILNICGNFEEAEKLFKKIPPPDPVLFPWTAYQYHKHCSRLIEKASQSSDSIPELGKALLASSFCGNRILAHNSIFAFDLTLLSAGYYTWSNILDRVQWFKTIFSYYGARRLIALIDSNLMIAHLSLLNRNTSLQHCEAILKDSSDLIRGSLTSCTYTLASLAFLIQQPEKAASILNFLKQSGAVLIPGILEGIEHFILTSSTEKLKDMGELRVFAETINLISLNHSSESWFASLKENSDKITPEIILNLCRKGYLLQTYVLLLIGIANGDLKADFIERNKWLFQAINTRFKRAGFLKLPLLKTPLELVTYILHNQTAENQTPKDNYPSDGNRLLNSTQICKTLVAQLEVEKVWVLRKKIDSIEILSSSEDNISAILPSWVTVALEWLNDSAYDRIDIPSEGWIRGYPHPGVYVIEIKHSEQSNNSHQFYVAVESLKPGKVLNKHKVEKLALISGLLTQATLYEKETPQLKGTLISEI